MARSMRGRLEQLERDKPAGAPEKVGGLAPVMRELDRLIARLESHQRVIAADEEGYEESFDEALYGESLNSHIQRVDKLYDEYDQAHPNSRSCPEIDKHIAEIEAEIAELKAGRD